MPELPEVETIVRQLKRRIKNKIIQSVNVVDNKMITGNLKKIVNCKVVDIHRRAKSIVIELEKNNTTNYLLIHLRMTGHFHYFKDNNNMDVPRFIAVEFHFKDNSLLTHNSIRKFGTIELLDNKELKNKLLKYGIEPLSKEFTVKKLKEIFEKKKKSNVKVVLLDQSLIAGIGNIYAQEILYQSKVSPLRKCLNLSEKEIKDIHKHTIEILKCAIKNKGSTVDNYSSIDGSGNYQNLLKVYNKNKCPRGHKIIKKSIGGRGTSYCPICQKEEEENKIKQRRLV